MSQNNTVQKIKTIPLKMSWGDVALVYRRLAESGERRALEAMREEIARMGAAAEALNAITKDLPDALQQRVSEVIVSELAKQGF